MASNSSVMTKDKFRYFWALLKTILAGKVDTESGKGLSTNDYTTAEKNKLAAIDAGANAYTLPTASSSTLGGVKIGTRLTISEGVLSADSQTDNNFTTALKNKLDGIETSANNYSLPTASASVKGGVMVGAGLAITDGVLSATGTTVAEASASSAGTMSAAHFTKLEALPTAATLASTYATKQEITGVYKYKGSVAAAANLPSSGQETGDVYNIESSSVYGAAGANVAWNGSAWDPLGEIFTIEEMTNSDIDSILAT